LLRWIALLLIPLAGCGGKSAPGDWSAAERAQILSLSLAALPAPPADASNAHADDPRAAELGRRLFHDRRLSRNGTIACANCHLPERFFMDGLPVSQGLGLARRNAPSLLGAAWSPWQFWDGRSDSLWSQVFGPLEDANEQGLSRLEIAQIVAAHYRDDYEVVFGRLPRLEGASPADINRVVANTGKALAAFQRRLRPQPARFDAFAEALRRDDPDALRLLGNDEQAGLRLFLGRGQCLRCHHGPLLTNHGFHNTGLAARPGQGFDRGRADGIRQVLASEFNCRGIYSDAGGEACPHLEFLRPGTPELVGAFKTPGLRNVAATAPYMHDGRFASLREVLEHYNRAPQPGMEFGHTELFPLGLTDAELLQLEAFLGTLGPAPAGANAGRGG
jgi:cytochrome c peroxidase